MKNDMAGGVKGCVMVGAMLDWGLKVQSCTNDDGIVDQQIIVSKELLNCEGHRLYFHREESESFCRDGCVLGKKRGLQRLLLLYSLSIKSI